MIQSFLTPHTEPAAPPLGTKPAFTFVAEAPTSDTGMTPEEKRRQAALKSVNAKANKARHAFVSGLAPQPKASKDGAAKAEPGVRLRLGGVGMVAMGCAIPGAGVGVPWDSKPKEPTPEDKAAAEKAVEDINAIAGGATATPTAVDSVAENNKLALRQGANQSLVQPMVDGFNLASAGTSAGASDIVATERGSVLTGLNGSLGKASAEWANLFDAAPIPGVPNGLTAEQIKAGVVNAGLGAQLDAKIAKSANDPAALAKLLFTAAAMNEIAARDTWPSSPDLKAGLLEISSALGEKSYNALIAAGDARLDQCKSKSEALSALNTLLSGLPFYVAPNGADLRAAVEAHIWGVALAKHWDWPE